MNLITYKIIALLYDIIKYDISGACPGIRKGGGAQNLKAFFLFIFFLLFNFSGGGGPSSENS